MRKNHKNERRKNRLIPLGKKGHTEFGRCVLNFFLHFIEDYYYISHNIPPPDYRCNTTVRLKEGKRFAHFTEFAPLYFKQNRILYKTYNAEIISFAVERIDLYKKGNISKSYDRGGGESGAEKSGIRPKKKHKKSH